jgi:hypothetical protein
MEKALTTSLKREPGTMFFCKVNDEGFVEVWKQSAGRKKKIEVMAGIEAPDIEIGDIPMGDIPA